MTDKVQKIKAIIQQYANKGEILLEESYAKGEHASTTGYWDGYTDCAKLLLKEIDSSQEEPKPKKCMFTLEEFTEEDRKVLCEDCDDDCEYAKKVKPVSEDLEDFALQYAGHHAPYDDCMQEVVDAVKAGAKWGFERINEALLSEVLPCFMHGGEADEVVAKLDEVLSQKK